MRFLVYSDLQATDGSDPCFHDPTKTLQHYRVEKFFVDAARIYKEHGCCGVIDLGDTTDDRTAISWPTLEVLGAGLARLPLKKDWDFKVTGNHEQFLRNCEINNHRLFEHCFNVITGCEIFDFGSHMAFFASFTEDYAGLTRWLTETAREYRNRPKLLFGHFQVVGARMNSGTALQGVPVNILKQFDLVLLGHIHIPQTIGGCIHYVGSPFQQDWGETGETKRVGILDTAGCKMTWVPMEGYPEYHEVTLEEFKQASRQEGEDRFKVILTSQAETEAFLRHPHFHRAEPVYTYAEALPEEAAIQEDWSFEGILRRYVGLVPPKAAGIEKTDEEMLELGRMMAKGEL
jgi:hypothetical protein